jgi:putative protein-disulfide isomerase
MAEVGAQGFPTFVLETPDGLQIVDFAACLGRPQAFRELLCRQTGLPTISAPAEALSCDVKDCSS